MTSVTGKTYHPSELWQGFWGVQVLHVGQSLGLFEALTIAKSAESLAAERGLEPRYVKLWCEAALSYRLLVQEAENYQTDPECARWLLESQGFTFTHLHLARRANEMLSAVFGGRALPEPQISLRLMLQENLQANYQWFFQQCAQANSQLESRLSQPGRVLEIGCGVGYGLSFLRNFYPALELFGLEADFECAQESERTTKSIIHVGELPGKRFAQGFDLIICFRSLSAVSAPRQLLLECAELLKDDGFFLLGSETNDENPGRKCVARQRGERLAYNLLAGESLVNSFSRAELLALLSESGLRVENEIPAPDWATPILICRKGG